MYPTGCSDNNSSLGILGHRWNIYANALDAASINTAGVISAYNMYMNKEKVATEPWVYNLLADVWNALNSLNDATGSNAGSIGKLGGALANQAITKLDILANNTSINKSGYLKVDFGFNITGYNKKGGTVVYDNMDWELDLTHGHSLTGSFSEGTFTCTIGAPTFNTANSYEYDVTTSSWYKRKIAEAYN
jgi:hypothetical protein